MYFWFGSSYKIDTILANPLQVEIDNGLVEGRQLSSSLFAWSGIPFAKPPVGELRFELPLPVSNWEDVWNATFERNQCVQTLLGEENYIGDEDCLYINVYTPKLPSDSGLLPVMVWIYGGGFMFGESNYSSYGPDQLVSEDVIVVTFNYRLGILGFAFTDDDAIFAFTDDDAPSAGAASVAYLVISPSAKDLFHRAIIQSGSTLCLWSLSKVAREATFRIEQ
ncbi:Carboxylesterase family [Popillia japonica]|uniref:Carboxylesterase family n=1 Tax=Popillia japonica TaxID=7064 RepID=A0AAW1IDH8_POPJA